MKDLMLAMMISLKPPENRAGMIRRMTRRILMQGMIRLKRILALKTITRKNGLMSLTTRSIGCIPKKMILTAQRRMTANPMS